MGTHPSPTSAERGNVLVIEDDRDTAEAILLLLANAGFGVRKVTSRDDALKVLKSNLYRCIVLDLNMPGLSAEDFMRKVRQHYQRSKVVLLTAIDQAEQQANRLGLEFYIGTPFDPLHLIALVERASG
jgi:CheY-like chemotaxis protein